MSIQTQAFNSSIQRVGIVRLFARESEIVHEGDPANCVYEVISGTVCTCKMLREKDVGNIPAFISQAMFSDWKAPKNRTWLPKRSPTLRFGSSKNKR